MQINKITFPILSSTNMLTLIQPLPTSSSLPNHGSAPYRVKKEQYNIQTDTASFLQTLQWPMLYFILKKASNSRSTHFSMNLINIMT